MNRKIVSVIALILIAPGCAKINSTGISYANSDAQRLFVWKSNYSAGMGTNNGICAQGALTAFASNTKVNIDIPVLNKPLTAEQANTVALLNSSNNQTTYANISFFYLCQIVLNSMKKTESVTEWTDKDGILHRKKDFVT